MASLFVGVRCGVGLRRRSKGNCASGSGVVCGDLPDETMRALVTSARRHPTEGLKLGLGRFLSRKKEALAPTKLIAFIIRRMPMMRSTRLKL